MCTQWLRHDVTAGSDINDQLINITRRIHRLNVANAPRLNYRCLATWQASELFQHLCGKLCQIGLLSL